MTRIDENAGVITIYRYHGTIARDKHFYPILIIIMYQLWQMNELIERSENCMCARAKRAGERQLLQCDWDVRLKWISILITRQSRLYDFIYYSTYHKLWFDFNAMRAIRK